MSQDFDRPPYVEWHVHAIEDRTASLAAGHYVARDVDYAHIMRPGSRDKLEKEAQVWLADLAKKARENQVPPTWHPAFAASYKAWKEGLEEPLNGTAIKNWPPASPAQVRALTANGIKTVEDIAGIPDQELGILGMGGVGLREKARSWLKAAEGTGKLAEENAALKIQLTGLQEQVVTLSNDLKALKDKK